MAESIHDREVRRQAERLQGQGYDVSADISGYRTPAPIGRKNPTLPDIVAMRGDKTVLLEVETAESARSRHAQQQMETLRRRAAQRNNAGARQVIAKRKKT